jgi:MtN3 and saliva related transmembrane protein
MTLEPITLIGLAAAACTTGSFLPQALKVIRTKDTHAISLSMYVILVVGVALWLAYGIFLHDIPIIVANLLTLVLAGTVLGLKIKYK